MKISIKQYKEKGNQFLLLKHIKLAILDCFYLIPLDSLESSPTYFYLKAYYIILTLVELVDNIHKSDCSKIKLYHTK